MGNCETRAASISSQDNVRALQPQTLVGATYEGYTGRGKGISQLTKEVRLGH